MQLQQQHLGRLRVDLARRKQVLYVDFLYEEEDFDGNYDPRDPDSDINFTVGGIHGGSSLFHGYVDEFGIADRILTPSEINFIRAAMRGRRLK